MRIISTAVVVLVGAAWFVGIVQPAAAQQVDPFNPLGHFIYPGEGQTPEQLEKDKRECYAWSSEQNQFDPYAAYQKAAAAQQQAAAAGQPQGDVMAGATRGAIGGLIIGQIAGDAGQGAAIGAVAGGLMGNRRRRSRQQSAEAEAAQAQAEAEAMLANWDRAYMACLQGRKYTVG